MEPDAVIAVWYVEYSGEIHLTQVGHPKPAHWLVLRCGTTSSIIACAENQEFKCNIFVSALNEYTDDVAFFVSE